MKSIKDHLNAPEQVVCVALCEDIDRWVDSEAKRLGKEAGWKYGLRVLVHPDGTREIIEPSPDPAVDVPDDFVEKLIAAKIERTRHQFNGLVEKWSKR